MNRGIFVTLMIFQFSLFPSHLFSQNTGFHTEVQTRFIQRISWLPHDYALRYEVEIEREESGVFMRHSLVASDEAFIEVSLFAGIYRYRVIPYNLINRPGLVSEWMEFEIITALNPELTGFSPDSFSINNEGGRQEYILSLFGNNLSPGAVIHLQNINGSIITPVGINILNEGREARLTFTFDSLIHGIYLIRLINPGSLETSIFGFIINHAAVEDIDIQTEAGYVRGFNFYIGTGWTMPLDIHGENDSLTEQVLHGVSLRLGVVSSGFNFFNFGMEFAGVWFLQEAEQPLMLECNLLLQKQFFNRKTAFTLRTGAGVIMPDDAVFYFNSGLSFLWLPFYRLYFEIGVNYSYLFEIDNHSSRLRPWAGVGIRF